jgi:hypothetical protein
LDFGNETYTIERRTSKIFVPCRKSDVTPRMANRNTTVDMAVKWRLNLRKRFVCSGSIPQKSQTTNKQGFQMQSHKNLPCANSINFLGSVAILLESCCFCHILQKMFEVLHSMV